MTACRPSRLHFAQRGAGALLVVVLLYAAMTLTVLFANRSLLFEHKTGANQYRATLALEAAEAGLEWATALLGASHGVDARCMDAPWPAQLRFRERYLRFDRDGQSWWPRSPDVVVAACTTSLAAEPWSCHCPELGQPLQADASAAGGLKPSFAVAFVARAGSRLVDVVSRGCSAPLEAGGDCPGDATAIVRATLASLPALVAAPAAPLAARGAVRVEQGRLAVRNADAASGGLTLQAGLGVDLDALDPEAPPGTPAALSVSAPDAALRRITPEQGFVRLFGVSRSVWRESMADARLACPCGATEVQRAFALGARKLWLDGDLLVPSTATLGRADDPLLLVVDGRIDAVGTLVVHGLVHAAAGRWAGADSLLAGAAVFDADLVAAAATSVAFRRDPRVLAQLLDQPGRFVRVPGSWRDQ